MTSRRLVRDTLEFKNTSSRAPRQLWTLPWATKRYPSEVERIRADFPDDITEVPPNYKKYRNPPKIKGDWFSVGEFIDEWGCVFTNIHDGVSGEVKHPLVPAEDEQWNDTSNVHIPEELLTLNKEAVNEFCANADKFVIQNSLARPFERLQFIRGTENLLLDFALKPKKMFDFLDKMHDFYCKLFETWGQTDVDALFFMDDWGTQTSMLVNPKTWIHLFKPMYRDYSDIAKKYGKKIFFHSDGYTLDIIPHLIDIGIDAVNLQIFCIGLEKLKQFKGKITFWGEIDRQRLLPNGTKKDIQQAVAKVIECLWQDGGAIAHCELGLGARPENIYTVYETWSHILG